MDLFRKLLSRQLYLGQVTALTAGAQKTQGWHLIQKTISITCFTQLITVQLFS